MNEKAPCFYLFIGRGITAMISFSASKTPRDKFNILSTHLTLVFYAVNMYLRTYKIESLAYTAKIGNATEYDDMLWYDRVYQFFISAMLVRAAVCHVSFWMYSTVEEANGERLFAFLLQKYLAIFKDIYANQV